MTYFQVTVCLSETEVYRGKALGQETKTPAYKLERQQQAAASRVWEARRKSWSWSSPAGMESVPPVSACADSFPASQRLPFYDWKSVFWG